jgi:hypothetical protein
MGCGQWIGGVEDEKERMEGWRDDQFLYGAGAGHRYSGEQ